jgi:hypothetical protein
MNRQSPIIGSPIIGYRCLRNLAAALVAGALLAFLPGCPPPAPPPPVFSTTAPAAQSPLMGPCADQLGDVLEQLLVYFRVYKELPAREQDLARVGTINVPLACPSTHAPYVYNPAGIAVPNWAGRLILYDSCPHGDFRRGILIERMAPGQPLAARVIAISEKEFQTAAHLPAPTSGPSKQ